MMLFIFNSRISSCLFGKSSNLSWTLETYSTQQLLFATSLFLPIETLFLLDFVQKLRQVASASEPLFVAENLVSMSPAIEMILDFAIVFVHIRSLHKLNFEMTTPNIDSASGPRGN